MGETDTRAPVQLTPLASAAIQLPLLLAATAALLRGPRGVRWLRVVLLGLAWVIVQTIPPLVGLGGGDTPPAGPVAAVVVAGLLVALFAAVLELLRCHTVTLPAVAAIVVLSAAFLVVPESVGLGLALASWVGGTLLLGWTFTRAARQHPGSLLEARLRLLAGASWLLAAAALSPLGGPPLVVWGVPLVVGTLILVLAVAPPTFLRLVLSQTRQVMRRTDTGLAAVGKDQPDALPDVVGSVCAVFGAEAGLLVDDGEVAVSVGDPDMIRHARAWAAAADTRAAANTTAYTTAGTRADTAGTHADREPGGRDLVPLDDGHWLLAGDTGRGQLVVVLSSVGVLLSRTDREQIDGIAERFGVVLTREEARRADELAAASMRAAERMRDDMLSTLSHELRTPLTTIMGFAEVLRRHAGSLSAEQTTDMLDRLVQRGTELEMIVSALLDLTAVRGRSEPGRIAVYELRDLVDRAVLRAEGVLADHPVEVAGDPGLVHSDGGAVLAVLEELLHNAAAYSADGTPVRLALGTHGDDVVVEVVDEGPGLGDLGPAGVFHPFVRGGDVMTRNTRGVGIGLTIARELAHQLGGTLTAMDTGTGAVFRLRFPRSHDLAPRGGDIAPVSAEHAVGDPTLVPSGRRGEQGRAAEAVQRARPVGPPSAVRGSG